MDVIAVMTEIDTRLKTISGLSVDMGFPGKLARVPAAVQYPPQRVDLDQTYGRGSDTMSDLIVVVFVGRQVPRQALKDIGPYVAGSGSKSIVAKLTATAAAPYTSASDVHVDWFAIDGDAQIGGNDYLAALFHLTVTGPGA